MKTAGAFLLFVAILTAGRSAELRQQDNDTLGASLKAAAGEDARLTLNEIESVLGKPDRVEKSPTWKSAGLYIYLLPDGRRLEVTLGKENIYLAVIIGKAENTLIQK
jgi:hypothetical protein